MDLPKRARDLYEYIATKRLVGLVPDIGFTREGQTVKSITLPNSDVLRIFPESYNAMILYSILNKLVKGSLVYMGDPGLGKTTAATIMGLCTGRTYNEVKIEVVHGHPQLTVSDLYGRLSIVAYKKGKVRVMWHPRMKNKKADLIIDEINRIPTKTQSTLLSLLAERYVEVCGKICNVNLRAVFATMNDRNGGGTYELMHALRDRFNIAVIAYPRNHMYTLDLPENTDPIPEGYQFKEEELPAIREQITKIPISDDAKRRLQFFMSMVNPAEAASHDPEHASKANLSGSNVKTAYLFNAKDNKNNTVHDDAKEYPGAWFEGTLSDRFIPSVFSFAKALAWFRGKKQADTEDVAVVVRAALLHKVIPTDHMMKVDLSYKFDAWARCRAMWEKAMEKFNQKHGDTYPETHTALPKVPAFYSEEQYNQAKSYKDIWALQKAVSQLPTPQQKLACITKSMQEYANSYKDGSAGLDELLAMRLVFQEVYSEVLVNNVAQESTEISGLEQTMRQLGMYQEVSLAGKSAGAVIVTEAGLKQLLGTADLSGLFAACPKKDYKVTPTGVMVDLDLHQQKAILKALTDKYPQVVDKKLGLITAEGVAQTGNNLNELLQKNCVSWFYSGERKALPKGSDKYLSAGIVTAKELFIPKKDNSFTIHQINSKSSGEKVPETHDEQGAMVLAGQL
jgi:MoxR-like ATPase